MGMTTPDIAILFAAPNALLAVYCLVRGRGKDVGWNRLAALQVFASVGILLIWSMA